MDRDVLYKILQVKTAFYMTYRTIKFWNNTLIFRKLCVSKLTFMNKRMIYWKKVLLHENMAMYCKRNLVIKAHLNMLCLLLLLGFHSTNFQCQSLGWYSQTIKSFGYDIKQEIALLHSFKWEKVCSWRF